MSDYYVKILFVDEGGYIVPELIPVKGFTIFDAVEKAQKVYKESYSTLGYKKIGYTIVDSEGNEY